MNGSAIAEGLEEDARTRLRYTVEARLGLGASSLSNARVDEALAALLDGAPLQGREAALAALSGRRTDDPVWQRLISVLAVGETSFFRQRSWFAHLEDLILEPLIAAKRPLRIWSAGCASGEEPYSIAIAVSARLPSLDQCDVRIVGSDICAERLASARLAHYRAWSLRECTDVERADYFRALDEARFELRPHLRGGVEFVHHNLVDDVPVHPALVRGGVDLVICRNVLMYLTPAVQRAVATRLTACLAPGGWLAVSAVEANAEWFPTLTRVNAPSAIFFRRDVRSP